MITKKIKFLKSSKFSVHSKPSSRLIDKKLLDYISTLPNNLGSNKTLDNKDLRIIAKYFGVKLILRQKYKYSGTAHIDCNRITLKTGLTSQINRNKRRDKIRGTFCHELAHIFQHRLKISYEGCFSSVIRGEQEAESAAIILYKKLFPFRNFTKDNFTAYFKEGDLIFLEKYYNHIYPNDSFKWQK